MMDAETKRYIDQQFFKLRKELISFIASGGSEKGKKRESGQSFNVDKSGSLSDR